MSTMTAYRISRAVRVAAGLCLVVVLCSAASAEDRLSFSAFASMSTGDLDSLQVKCTSVLPRFGAIPTFVITAQGHAHDLTLFRPFYREGFAGFYTSDFAPPIAIALSTTTLASLIDSLEVLPGVTDGGVDSLPCLSFALCNIVDGETKVFESMLDLANAQAAFRHLRQAASDAGATERTIDEYACAFGMRTDSPPSNVTGSVGLSFGGIRRDRHGVDRFVQRVKLKNTSQQSIVAPIWLVLMPAGNVDLAQPTGITCLVDPRGSGYLKALSSGSLAPNQTIEISIPLTNPDSEPVTYLFRRVYAGLGKP